MNNGGTGRIGTGNSNQCTSIWTSNAINSPLFLTLSDRRKKENIQKITSSVADAFLDKVKPVQYTFIDKKNSGLKYGFIAQDIIKAGFGDLVGIAPDKAMKETKDKDGFVSPAGATFSISYESVIPILVKAAQDQDKIIKHFTKAIKEQEALLDSDHDAIAKLKSDNNNLRREFEAYRAAHP